MAKYEKSFTGNFQQVLRIADQTIMRSMSSSMEHMSNVRFGDTHVAVRVYERYSMFGGNRVSLNLTVVGEENRVFVSAITSGGSQAMFFKLNTLGEEHFLAPLEEALDRYAKQVPPSGNS